MGWNLLNMEKVLIPTTSHLSKWIDVQQCLLTVTLLTVILLIVTVSRVTVSNCISLSQLLSLNWPRLPNVSLFRFF